MIKGRINKQHESFVCTIPKLLCNILELGVGDEISFELMSRNRKIVIAPVRAAKQKTERNEANARKCDQR